MTRISYKSNQMIGYALPNLKDSISTIKKAIDISTSLNIPGDFSEISYLKSLPDKLKKNLNNMNRLTDWISNNDNTCNKITSETSDIFNNIESVIIKKRIGYISRK